MLRGQQSPGATANGYQHPVFPLIAKAENMRVGHIGVEQYFVRGDVLRKMEFPPDRPDACDGVAAEKLAFVYRGKIRFEPDLYVLFNRLEPGRWEVDYEDTHLLPA
jgi:hypothetical protein